MRNVWRIFKDDLRLVGSSIVSVLIVLGLCLAPAVCAWTGIIANWNPHDNTGRLKVAVSNGDDGYESSLMPIRLNIGDRVVSLLRENDDYDWVFVDEWKAIEGVRSGEYYAALTIPRDFSSKMMSVLSTGTEQADVGFYLNTKKNPVASILADAGGGEVEDDIRAKFTETVDAMSSGLTSDLVSFAGGNDARDFSARLVAHLDTAAEDLDAIANQIRSYANLIDASLSLAKAASGSLSGSEKVDNTVEKLLDDSAETLDAAIDSAQSAASSIEQQVAAAKEEGGLSGVGTGTASSLASDVAKLASSVDTVASQADAVSASLKEAVKSLSGSTESVTNTLERVLNQLSVAANKINASSAKIKKFQEDVAGAIAKGNLADVATIISNSNVSLTRWSAEPSEILTFVAYPVENSGSSLAPFFAVLSLWAGAILLVVVMRGLISRERIRRYEEKSGQPVKAYEQYLGRYLTFALIALVQASVLGLGDLFFLRIQCVHPILFLAACWACAIVFSNIAYTLASSFGGMGTALCAVILAMSVAGANGEHFAQLLDGPFLVAQSLLPLTYGMRTMQEAIAGMYDLEYVYNLLIMAAFLLPSLFLGLAIRRPIARFAAYCSTKLQDTAFLS